MPTRDDARLLKRLLVIFRVEAADHIKAMSSQLSSLEAATSEAMPALVESLFREAHSLKGAARSVNLTDIEVACKALEEVLAELKRQPPAALPTAWFAARVGDLDRLETLLSDIDAAEPTATVPPAGESTPPPAETPRPSLGPERPAPAASDTVRMSTTRLAALLVGSEALLACKFGAGHLVDELRAVSNELAQWRKSAGRSAGEARAWRRRSEKSGPDQGGEMPTGAIERLLDSIEHDEQRLKMLDERLAAIQRLAEQDRRALAVSVDGLQTDIRAALMQPFSSLLELFPKLVRDLARDSGKEVELQIEGADLEIDRRILEQLKDPLIHLVRNAVDHGIEKPAERRASGKPAAGRIRIAITPREGSRIELLIADDGAGIDPEKICAAAAKLGLTAPAGASAPDRQTALGLVFKSGLSTSPILTDISGRGLGLAIVREKVEMLSGNVAIESPEGGGTSFRIVLPTTLATFRGLLVAIGEQQFVLPSHSVERVLSFAVDAIKTLENREAVEVDGEAVALVRLADALGVPPAPAAGADSLQLAVVEGSGHRIAFAVDAVVGDQEVLVKGLGPQLARVPNFSGATVLGAGRVVPIIDIADLLKSALRAGAKPVAAAEAAARQQSLLVVEDSITARSLLKNILESAGYRVGTAVDGIDALTELRTGDYDLLVSDVEMPRMDGFELTARLRGEAKFADLPVILVTALESREDRERGVEAGANAYIVKSSFDQSNLFEAIRRLI